MMANWKSQTSGFCPGSPLAGVRPPGTRRRDHSGKACVDRGPEGSSRVPGPLLAGSSRLWAKAHQSSPPIDKLPIGCNCATGATDVGVVRLAAPLSWALTAWAHHPHVRAAVDPALTLRSSSRLLSEVLKTLAGGQRFLDPLRTRTPARSGPPATCAGDFAAAPGFGPRLPPASPRSLAVRP